MFAYFNVLVSTGLTIYTVHKFPVFTPNEYFWQHHWDGKEEKWVAFARAVRAVMAEFGGLE